MSDKKVFVDTNILLYAYDKSAGRKNVMAAARVKQLWKMENAAVISVQVLHEFYVNLIKKKMSPDEAEEIVRLYLSWEVVSNDVETFEAALSIAKRWKLSFWDSVIVAAAQHAEADILWSEDFSNAQRFGSLTIENPLLG